MNVNKTIVLSLAVISVAAVALGAVFYKPTYTPHTDTLTFERVIDNNNDLGRQLNTADLISKEGIRLADIFSMTEKQFTLERRSRYGADRKSDPGGYGLTVNFVQKRKGEKDAKKTFTLTRWESFEQTKRPARRTQVEDAEPRLAEAVMAFAGPIKLDLAFYFVLDTTEGVDKDLAHRSDELIDESKATKFVEMGHSVVVNLYHLTESSYQGGRRSVDLPDERLKTAREWYTTPQAGEKNSSVLRGLRDILTEVKGSGKKSPVVHVLTNGLENLPELSVYKNPELLEEANWAKLDQIADLSKLDLPGVEIHLHPLPVSKTSPGNLMEKALNYLADRLEKAGARVTVEPL